MWCFRCKRCVGILHLCPRKMQCVVSVHDKYQSQKTSLSFVTIKQIKENQQQQQQQQRSHSYVCPPYCLCNLSDALSMIVTHYMARYHPNSQFLAVIKNSRAPVITFNDVARFSSLNIEI
jgi:hypothetical protein